MKKNILSVILCIVLTATLISACTDESGSKVSYSSEGSAASSEIAVQDSTAKSESADTISGDSTDNTDATASADQASTASADSFPTSVTDINWKNPHAHRKPSSGVAHSEEDYKKHLTVYCLNEGKADAFVMFVGTNNAVVIDCGRAKDGDDILEILEEQGIDHISALIVTHFDKDHVGGADEVINGSDVEKIYTTHGTKDSKQVKEFEDAMELNNKTPIVVREYTSFEVDGTTYEIFPPLKESYGDEDNESNNSSLVVKVTNADNSILFAGDVENERLPELIASDYDLTCDILKVPHHGRIEKLTEQFIKKVTPQYAIITSSSDEPEDQEVLNILKNFEVETYLTRNGEILIDTLPGEIKIDQYDD
ncbi:MAG: MBL fold metallo-hydrolase [Lachnospiraceae bacterium]|nr:MBL fold metallo-hydrolase [Lachnospiraceae bacterium]